MSELGAGRLAGGDDAMARRELATNWLQVVIWIY